MSGPRSSVVNGSPSAFAPRPTPPDRIVRRLRAGEVLFHEGDAGSTMFMVITGLVGTERSSGHHEAIVTHVFRPTDCLGVLQFLSPGTPHHATARALTDVSIEVIRRSSTDDSLVSPDATALLDHCGRHLDELSFRLVEAINRRAPARVAAAVLRLAGEADDVAVSQDTVAAVAGVVRATANGQLRSMERKRWVRLERRQITILDRHALQRACR